MRKSKLIFNMNRKLSCSMIGKIPDIEITYKERTWLSLGKMLRR